MDGDLYVIPQENSFSFHLFFFRLIFPSPDFFLLSFPSDFFLSLLATFDLFLSSMGTTCISIRWESAIKTKRCHSFPSTFLFFSSFFLLFLIFIWEKGSIVFSSIFFLLSFFSFDFADDGRKCVQGTNNSFSSRCDPILRWRWCSVCFPNRSVSELFLELSSHVCNNHCDWTHEQFSNGHVFAFNATGFFLFPKILLHLFKKWISSLSFQSSN